jgi:hypothetical protein
VITKNLSNPLHPSLSPIFHIFPHSNSIPSKHSQAVKIVKHQQQEREKKDELVYYLKHLRDEERYGTREDAHEFGEYQAKK